MTFNELAEKTLEKAKKPLSPNEIWEKANEYGITEKFQTQGKTPWASIGARIYTDIRDNENTKFIQISKRPSKFYLKRLVTDEIKLKQEVEKDIESKEKDISKSTNFNERDLHPLLVKFINSDTPFFIQLIIITYNNNIRLYNIYYIFFIFIWQTYIKRGIIYFTWLIS